MNRGFVALISIVLIAGFLLISVVSASFHGFYARLAILERENKEQGRSLARACAESVRLRIAQSPTYDGEERIEIQDTKCTIGKIILIEEDNHFIFTVTVPYMERSTIYEVRVDVESLSITSLREIPNAK